MIKHTIYKEIVFHYYKKMRNKGYNDVESINLTDLFVRCLTDEQKENYYSLIVIGNKL